MMALLIYFLWMNMNWDAISAVGQILVAISAFYLASSAFSKEFAKSEFFKFQEVVEDIISSIYEIRKRLLRFQVFMSTGIDDHDIGSVEFDKNINDKISRVEALLQIYLEEDESILNQWSEIMSLHNDISTLANNRKKERNTFDTNGGALSIEKTESFFVEKNERLSKSMKKCLLILRISWKKDGQI